jgi:hypothetical protein
MTRLALALLLTATSADAESFAERWPRPLAVESTSAVMPPVILVQDEDKPIASRHRRRAATDICTRHGMQKVITRGGKSWRCRK